MECTGQSVVHDHELTGHSLAGLRDPWKCKCNCAKLCKGVTHRSRQKQETTRPCGSGFPNPSPNPNPNPNPNPGTKAGEMNPETGTRVPPTVLTPSFLRP